MQYVLRFKDLEVYKRARKLAGEIFLISCSFPKEEKYSLTDQIRRASRSIGGQVAEAWGKRNYPKHFISKLADADGEQLETQHWVLVSIDSGYINLATANRLCDECEEIGKMLGGMMQKADSFCRK